METTNNKPGLLKKSKLERRSGNFEPKIAYNTQDENKNTVDNSSSQKNRSESRR